MSNTIHLPIKREWFDMILSGEKKEEYRSLTNYWSRRLTNHHIDSIKEDYGVPCEHVYVTINVKTKEGRTTVTLTNGYSSDSPRIVVELTGLKIKQPNLAWCPPDTEGLWFALGLGRVINVQNISLPERIKYFDRTLHLRTFEQHGLFTVEYTSDLTGNSAEVRCAIGNENATVSEVMTWFSRYPRTYKMI